MPATRQIRMLLMPLTQARLRTRTMPRLPGIHFTRPLLLRHAGRHLFLAATATRYLLMLIAATRLRADYCAAVI